MKKIALTILSFLWLAIYTLLNTAHAGIEVWSFEPSATFPPSINILATETKTIKYNITNLSPDVHALKMTKIQGINFSGCSTPLSGGQSCTLTLSVKGSLLTGDILGGPQLCERGNPNECYQPNEEDSLAIHRFGATITVTPSALNFARGGTGEVKVTNLSSSLESANNVAATIPLTSSINVLENKCPASLAPGATCTITFEASATESGTAITISGSNTNIVPVLVTVSDVTISINPTLLYFAQTLTGTVTVKNTTAFSVDAYNVEAIIPSGSPITQQSNTCTPTLAPGSTCKITFTSDTNVDGDQITIKGDNTNSVVVTVSVGVFKVIEIKGPQPQSRIVTVGSNNPLGLIIKNLASSTVSNIDVTDKTLCDGLEVDKTGCTSVEPNGTCTLQLTSPTPYKPCKISVKGDGTTTVETLIAFSYQFGLVFEKNTNGSGKVVTVLPFANSWTATNGPTLALSFTDGYFNTQYIVFNPTCSDNYASCSAYYCFITPPFNVGWYLPAIYELSDVHNVFCPSEICNFGMFDNKYFWSSTSPTDKEAFLLYFGTNTISLNLKSNRSNVACVHGF